jgi:hypothetical protein
MTKKELEAKEREAIEKFGCSIINIETGEQFAKEPIL